MSQITTRSFLEFVGTSVFSNFGQGEKTEASHTTSMVAEQRKFLGRKFRLFASAEVVERAYALARDASTMMNHREVCSSVAERTKEQLRVQKSTVPTLFQNRGTLAWWIWGSGLGITEASRYRISLFDLSRTRGSSTSAHRELDRFYNNATVRANGLVRGNPSVRSSYETFPWCFKVCLPPSVNGLKRLLTAIINQT